MSINLCKTFIRVLIYFKKIRMIGLVMILSPLTTWGINSLDNKQIAQRRQMNK